jgi:protein-arginine kinase activator protein McsA
MPPKLVRRKAPPEEPGETGAGCPYGGNQDVPLREAVPSENVESKDVLADMQRQRIQDQAQGGRMKTCPTCGSEVKELWKEHWCHCGCGICCRASDPGADDRIKEWKAKHKGKCHGKSKQ